MNVEEKKVGNVPVRIVNHHNFAIIPWAEARRQSGERLSLISLDHHSDSKEAFGRYAFRSVADEMDEDNPSEDKVHERREELVRQIDWNNRESVRTASTNLDHDEQIRAGIESEILCFALVICLQQHTDHPRSKEIEEYVERQAPPDDPSEIENWEPPDDLERPSRPFTYEEPEDCLFIPERGCVPGCRKNTHDEECRQALYASVLEKSYLEQQFSIFQEMAGEKFTERGKYILDIDLDLFHNSKSFKPEDPSKFYEIIRGAEMITIARERNCFESKWEGDDEVPIDHVEEVILEHIEEALGC